MENYSYNSYPESGHSSPRSREIDYENPPPPWEDPLSNQPPPNYKVKFMCSYGGKIHPRPHDNQLSYIGGETKILSVDRNIKFASLLAKLVALCDSDAISFKYQLPGEDLDALISVTNDDDLEHMMHEYDRLYRVSPKPARLRIFIFPSQSPGLTSARSFGSDEGKTEKERFVEALNSSPIVIAPQQSAPLPASAPPPAVNNVDLLFGFEKGNAMAAAAPPAHQPAVGRVQEFDDPGLLPGMDQRLVGSDPIQKHIQDLQRLRIEEQQGIYRRKSEDTPSGGSTGNDHNKMPEKMPQIPVSAGFPYWTEKQVTGGVYHNNEQQVYMIQTPANAYHAPMMRPVAGAPTQGYYAVQRTAADVYQQQQQHQQQQQQQQHQQQQMYNMAAAKATGYSENYGMVRPQTTGGVGMVNEAGYAQVAYDSGGGRQFVYSAPGGVMGAPAPVQAAQYQAVSADGRASGALTVEAGAKVAAAKPTQASI